MNTLTKKEENKPYGQTFGKGTVWDELKHKLPWKKTEEERQMRITQFACLDMNDNGYLSFAEVNRGFIDVIRLPFKLPKPVLMRAFTAAKTKVESKNKHGNDFVSKGEYRFLLKYIRQYYEYWVAFDRIDTDGDHRVSYSEFMQAIP